MTRKALARRIAELLFYEPATRRGAGAARLDALFAASANALSELRLLPISFSCFNLHLYGRAAPDRAGARPYQLQGKRSGSAAVSRLSIPSHFCHAELAHESRLLCLMPLHAAEHVAKKIKSQ